MVAVAIVIVIVIFAVLAVASWQVGFLRPSNTTSGMTAAILGIVATFITALASLAGIFLKAASDAQAERRLNAEAEKARAIQRESEARLKLEAAIRAVELLGEGKDEVAPRIKRAGALVTLSNLAEHSLTLALLTELLASNGISATAAEYVLNNALSSNDASLQSSAAHIFAGYSACFLTATGCEIPKAIFHGGAELSSSARRWAGIGLARLLLRRPLNGWQVSTIWAIVGALALVWRNETDLQMKTDLAAILGSCLAVLPEMSELLHPVANIDLKLVRREIADAQTEAVVTSQLIKAIQEWGAARMNEESQSGSAPTA